MWRICGLTPSPLMLRRQLQVISGNNFQCGIQDDDGNHGLNDPAEVPGYKLFHDANYVSRGDDYVTGLLLNH